MALASSIGDMPRARLRGVMFLALALACGSEESPPDPGAPRMQSVVLASTGFAPGEPSVIEIDGQFWDDEGDLESVEVDIEDPSGATQHVSVQLAAEGLREGSFELQIPFVPVVGAYSIVIRLLDAEGHESAPRELELEV